MQDIYVGSIISYDNGSGNYFVRLRGSSLDTERGVPARLLNPIPYEDGGGIKSAPQAPRDSQCLILKDGNRHYILGFLQPHGLVSYGDAKPVRSVEEGEMFITHKTRSKFGFSTIGTIVLLAQRWAQLAINPISQQLTAFFRNIRINLYSAVVEYFYDLDKKRGTFKIIATKTVDTSASIATTPEGGSSNRPEDRFVLKAGELDDHHIIQLDVAQDFTNISAPPGHASTTKIGTQNDGTYFSHKATTKDIELSLTAKDNATLNTNFKKGVKEIDLTFDVTGDNAAVLTVNKDKAIITVKHTGDVTIKTIDGAFINLGGQGKEQQLVTKKFVEQVFTNHIHSNGNQGAPTGPPLTPQAIDLGVDSVSGHYTYTTRAE